MAQKAESSQQDREVDVLDLQDMTIEDWLRWLRGRATLYDEFTGERLDGAGDPYAIVYSTLVRSDKARHSRLCMEAIFQILSEILEWLKEKETLSENQEFMLISLSELVSELPRPILRLVPRGDKVRTEALNLIELSFERVKEQLVSDRVIAALARFIVATGGSLTEASLLKMLKRPQISRLALSLLCEQDSDLQGLYWQEFIISNVDQDELPMIELEVEKWLRDIGKSAARSFFFDVMRGLDTEVRSLLLSLEIMKKVLGYSETREKLRRSEAIFFVYKGYLEGEEIDRMPADIQWARELRSAILDSASTFAGVNIEYHDEWPEEGWDEQAVLPGEQSNALILPLDPIYLARRRMGMISVVPYGLCSSLAVVYLVPGRPTDLSEFVTRVRNLRTLLRQDYEVGTIVNTAAEAEIPTILRDERIGRRPEPLKDVATLVNWLEADHAGRVVIADIGFVKAIEKRVEDRSAVQSRRFPYRKPILVGVPFQRQDLAWGEVLAKAVRETLYEGGWLEDGSQLQRKLESVGVEVLTRDLYERMEPLVPVDSSSLPFRIEESRVIGRYETVVKRADENGRRIASEL